jgi:hypothetical protein
MAVKITNFRVIFRKLKNVKKYRITLKKVLVTNAEEAYAIWKVKLVTDN